MRTRIGLPALALVVAATACGGEEQPSGETEKVTIAFLRNDNPPYVKATDEAFAAYIKQHPNVSVVDTTVRYRSVVTTLLADLTRDQLAADLVFMPPSIVCTFAENLADVPADVITLSQAQNTFFAAPLAGSICDGKLKALPMEYNLEYGGVVVNLDKYQKKFPGKTPQWTTWASFIGEAAALSEYDDTGVGRVNGLDLSPEWPQPSQMLLFAQILQRGGEYWTADGLFDFNTGQARDGLAAIVKWISGDKIMFPGLIPDSNTFVLNRLVAGATGYGWDKPEEPLSAMGYAGTWALAATRQLPQAKDREDRFAFFALPPMVGNQHRFAQNSGFAWAVPRTSKNQKVAWDMIKALTLSPEAAAKWAAIGGSLPALRANATAEKAANDPVLSQVQPLLEHGRWRGFRPAAAEDTIEAAIMTKVFDAAFRGKDVATALAEMEQIANDAIRASR
jgi:multiple sugar transport system substrate-binding protein